MHCLLYNQPILNSDCNNAIHVMQQHEPAWEIPVGRRPLLCVDDMCEAALTSSAPCSTAVTLIAQPATGKSRTSKEQRVRERRPGKENVSVKAA